MKKLYTFGTVTVLLGLLLWYSVPVRSQTLEIADKQRFQTRAKVWDIFWNNGIQGVWEQNRISFHRHVGMQYPGLFTVDYAEDFVNYWGVRFWRGFGSQTRAWYTQFTALMPGFHTFVSTVVDGDYHVSESKAAHASDDITLMAYDPSVGPEANIGYANRSPLGPVMSNWWPGQPLPGSKEVVEIHNFRYGQYMEPDKDMFAEDILIMHYTTKRGITVTKKVYAWSYLDYDDFEIMEYTFENTGDSDGDGVADLNGGAGLQLNDTFLVFGTRFFMSQAGHVWRNYSGWYRTVTTEVLDDVYKFTEADNYDGPASGQGLKMWYSFDGDNPLFPGDDLGQPFSFGKSIWQEIGPFRSEGEITAYQYAGVAPIAYTPGAANDPATWTYDTGGDASFVAPRVADQPHTVRWWPFRTRYDYDEPDSKTNTWEEMYNQFAGPAPSIKANSMEPGALHGSFAYGPYDLAPGDKVRIVLALVAAAPVEENFLAWAKLGKQEEMRTDKAFNNLVKHLNKAKEAFQWGYDLPDPPPDVGVTVDVTPDANNLLIWSAESDDTTDPDYSDGTGKDVAGYRVYRSDFNLYDWKLIQEIPVKDPKYLKGDKYEYADPKSQAGFEYLYNVRSYDTGHADWNGTGIAIPSLESGNSSPEQWANGVQTNSPFAPVTSEADRLQRKVVVVPNPYKIDGAHSYPGGGAIRFTNIPRKCEIRIFTMAGELFATIPHDSPTQGEVTWTQLPDTWIETAPAGIYFFIVESRVPGSEGQVQRGTFAVVK